MTQPEIPEFYLSIKDRFPAFFDALSALGKTARQAGPLDKKISHLIQLAAAAAIRSEGSVHSHTRRALQEGATPEEIYHAVILLATTIGFPNTAATLSWVDDIIAKKAAPR